MWKPRPKARDAFSPVAACCALAAARISGAAAAIGLVRPAGPLRRCEICGDAYDPRGFRVSIGTGGPGYHSLACAERARELG